MKVLSDGRVQSGLIIESSNDADQVITMNLFGKNGDMRSGSKLAFGDFGQYSHQGMNVFLGEYGDNDTDQLWLHGKLGFFLTSTGYANKVIAYYNQSVSTNFENDDLSNISTNNGTSKTFMYDVMGRLITWKETIVDNKWLQKDYTYTDGNISSIQYTSQSGVLVTENYIYSNGHVSEVNLNGETTVYKLSKENLFGQPTEAVTGGLTRIYGYTPYGLPSRRNTTGFSTAEFNLQMQQNSD